ncbi:MAG: hypothetical protein GY950_35485 [bacterium]|nr:hypothetical protein [bacterium]
MIEELYPGLGKYAVLSAECYCVCGCTPSDPSADDTADDKKGEGKGPSNELPPF